MSNKRRDFIKGAAAVGALGAIGFGYSHTANQVLKSVVEPRAAADPLTGNAPRPEYRVDPATGKVQLNPTQQVSYTVCMGCTSLCGVRVRVEKASDKVLRVTGSPYHTLSADPHLPYDTPVLESFAALGRHRERGLDGRATACGRGNAVLAKLDSPNRVRVPLKRVGPRGSGMWAPISFEQLVEEVTEGGDLFGEGYVDGLRAIRDLNTPLDPERPELGPKANQLAVIPPFNDGRLPFAKRFAVNSFGTKNFAGHRSYCGLSMRSGYAALLDNWKKQPHLKPDFANAEFMLFIGTAPGNAGNPFKRQGYMMAEGRARGVKYAVVDPVLTNADNIASDGGRWIPIRPNTDAALVMAMMRWMFEHEAYDAAFLSRPNPKAARAAGEASWSNATHLVVVAEGENYGRFLRGSDLGLAAPGKDDPFVVVDADGGIVAHEAAEQARLLHTGEVTLADGNRVEVATSLAMLKEAAFEHTLEQYADACGVPVETIVELARDFSAHGKRAAADCHGGTMGSNGLYAAYAVVMLNALVGNLNRKGGTSVGGGKFKEVAPGPRYDLATFPGMVKKPKGVGLGRNGFPYEKTTEFKLKRARGGSGYPSKAPWFPLTPNMASEFLPAALNGYPYPLKALILWSSNPVYGVAGIGNQVREALVDPQRLPLVVSVDPFINESNALADYIVPDSVLYESWGWASAWGAHLTKVSSARWPVVAPQQAQTADGRPIDMETFFIAVAKRIGLPGFGKGVIADAKGNRHDLERPEDFYLRAGANVAFDGGAVPDASDEEMAASGVSRIARDLKAVLKPEEWRKVAYVYARGGRFENADRAYDGDLLSHRYPRALQIYNEELALARNSLSGQRYRGTPYWHPPVLADGSPLDTLYPLSEWPLQAVSTKSQLQSSHTIGLTRLQQIRPQNPIALHPEDAASFGIRTGDSIRVTSPGGAVEGVALVRGGIQRGVVGIEHGFGHRELGARQHAMGKHRLLRIAAAGAGANHNDLGCPDPHRPGVTMLTDWVVGNVARQGLPVRIERI